MMSSATSMIEGWEGRRCARYEWGLAKRLEMTMNYGNDSE
jgi:hypothetical protein